MRRAISALLSMMLLAQTITPAFASDITTSGTSSSAKVPLSVQATTLAVTVPTQLPVTVDSEGKHTYATNTQISNNSSGPIVVSNITMSASNGWQVSDYATDLTKSAVGTKKIGFEVNGATTSDGDGTLNDVVTNFGSITAGGAQKLTYTAKIPPQSQAINTTNIANVVFTVDWYTGDNSAVPPLNATSVLDKAKMDTALAALTGTITFSTELPSGKVGADISKDKDSSIIAVVEGQDATVYAKGGSLAPADSSSLFNSYAAQQLNLSGLDTSNTYDMSSMLSGCYNLTEINLSSFNTSNVNYMDHMFYECSGLTNLDLRNFDTSNVWSMAEMFGRCSELTTVDLSSFNTSSLDSMYQMFKGCSSLKTVDLSSFNTPNLADAYGIFDGCSKLTDIDLSNFNTSNVTDMSYMFYNCYELTAVDLSSFSTYSADNTAHMFDYCLSLKNLDLSNFDMSNVTDMSDMLSNCNQLENIYVSTQADADRINNDTGKPSGVTVVVKVV